METKLFTRKSFSAVPCLKVSFSSDNEVAKVTRRGRSGSRFIFLDENGNENKNERQETSLIYEEDRKTFKEARQARRGSALLLRRRSSSLDAAKFMAYYVNRRNSNLRRDHFLRSFGNTTLRYPNLNEEDIMEDLNVENKTAIRYPAAEDAGETILNDSYVFLRRAASAGPVLMRQASVRGYTTPENLLELRGSEYTGNNPDWDPTAAIRKQSAKRRVKRIMEAEKERAEREKFEEEQRSKEKEREKEKKRRNLRSATFAVMATNVSCAGFNFKSFSEKKKWLTEKRLWTRQIASAKFRWAARVVIVLSRVLKALVNYSADLIPETAAQRSFRTLRDNSEVKEMLFNKSLYQRGKSQYAYVPEWAKKILMKSAMERSENELSQLHSVLKGLTSYDKFTYRIQLAMCRAMTYLKVEHPRVVLRKGHVGVGFYFIFSGSVFVNVEELLTKTGHVMWHTAITLHRGDSFGELALLRNIKRTASVVVREDTELLVVEKNVFSKTCPKIFDKELVDKIKFCKSLSLFEQWTDDALKNVCFEAQIQEWKANKIIVKDSSKEVEWIYLCMQGKCSVIKALDLRVPPKLPRPRRTTNDDIIYPTGLIRKKRRAQSDASKIWIRELEESLKTSFSFNESKKVDENREDNDRASMSDSESDLEDNVTGAEKILEVMDLSYKDEPHAKGDISYVLNEEDVEEEETETKQQPEVEIVPTELERRDKKVSENFSELIKSESETGKLNKDVVYLNIASMRSGDIFDISEVLRPTGRTLMLISKGAVMLRIKRHDFFRYSTKQPLRQAKKVVQELDYPSEEIIYRSYNERCLWEQLKSAQLQSTVGGIQEKCLRHSIAFTPSMPMAKKPLTPARVPRSPSRQEIFDQHLSFVYDSHKVPEDEGDSHLSSFVTKRASGILKGGTDTSKRLKSALGHKNNYSKAKKVTFGVSD